VALAIWDAVGYYSDEFANDYDKQVMGVDIGAVVPAFNEEERLPNVLSVVTACPFVRQVVVVDDGSQDNTARVAEQFSVRVIRFAYNRGKAAAVWTGLQEIHQPVVVLLDADLKGLCPGHVYALARPIALDSADMTLGIFKGGGVLTDLSHRLPPWVTGQRALPLERVHQLPDLSDLGYGLEATISKFAGEHHWRVKTVMLQGVSHVTKEEKLGVRRAFTARAGMYWAMGKARWASSNGKNRTHDEPPDQSPS
jgi:hypothetical protein